MLIREFKAKGKTTQYAAIDEAIKTAQFVCNKCVRFWIDHRGVGQKELYRHNTALRVQFPNVRALNSHACFRCSRKSIYLNCSVLRQL